jgi:hypothetical protein
MQGQDSDENQLASSAGFHFNPEQLQSSIVTSPSLALRHVPNGLMWVRVHCIWHKKGCGVREMPSGTEEISQGA